MSISKIRSVLLETMADLKAGRIKREDALAISNVSQTYMNSIKLEVEAYKALGGNFRLSDVFDRLDNLDSSGHVKGKFDKLLDSSTFGIQTEDEKTLKFKSGIQVIDYYGNVFKIKTVYESDCTLEVVNSKGDIKVLQFEDVSKILDK